MSDLIAIAYPDMQTAETVRDKLLALTAERSIELEDAVVVDRGSDGKVKLHQAHNTAAAGAVGGAVWGGLIGLLFLAPLLGMAVGAAAGGASGFTATSTTKKAPAEKPIIPTRSGLTPHSSVSLLSGKRWMFLPLGRQ